ncbi:MAG: lipopolysaccharide biosynthesis protein [Promethearchaeota archaeon]
MKEKYFVSIISALNNYVITYLAFYILFLTVEVELIGIYNLVHSVILIGFITSDLGFKPIFFKYSSKKNFYQYFSSFFFLQILSIFLSISFSLLLITFFQLWSSSYLIYFLIYLFSMITVIIANILRNYLISKKKIIINEFIFTLYSLSRNFVIIYLALNYSYISDKLGFLFISGFIIEIIFLGVYIFFSKNDLLKLSKPQKEFLFPYLKESKYIIIRRLLVPVAENIGNIILDYSFGHEYLGYFMFAYQIILALNIISQSLIPIYSSFYSKLFEENDVKSITNIVYKSERFTSFFFLSLIIIVLLNGELILSIILPKYLIIIPVLHIMIFMPYFLGISRPYDCLFGVGDKQSTFAFIGISYYALQIILIILLIPKKFLIFNTFGLGMIGYGLALIISSGFFVFICRYYSKKHFNIKFQKKIFLHIILAFISFFCLFQIKSFFSNLFKMNQVLILILSTLMILGLFLLLLLIFKQINRNDIKFILELFKLKNYKKTLMDEFAIS